MPEPVWAGPYSLEVYDEIEDCYVVRDGEGDIVVSPMMLVGKEAEALKRIVAAANAYPRLQKALEACRWLEAARRLAVVQITHWSKFTCLTYDNCQVKERRCLARAKRLAREALAMAEGRDGDSVCNP